MTTRLIDRLAARLPEPENVALSSDDAHKIAAELGTTYPAVKRSLWALVSSGVAGVDEWGFYRYPGRDA
jgi:predicted ArsR family transcriptional regulator